MHRFAPPPDFRFVWLLPGPSSSAIAFAAGTVGMGACALLLCGPTHPPATFALAIAGGVACGLAIARRDGRFARRAREVPMAIVPWGVLVNPDLEPRALRWAAIRNVTVNAVHTLRGGTPDVQATVVRIETDREALVGRTSGSAGLERLTVHLDAYAEESGRPSALDLAGHEEIPATEPGFTRILERAEVLCSTGQGASELHLPTTDYRGMARRVATPETLVELRRAFVEGGVGAADPRPLAILVAALLDARELVPDLLRLVASPHPLTAACAKAAALRLGAARNRAGAVDEIASFLFEEDLEALTDWCAPGAR